MIIQSLQNEKIKKLTKILTKNNERKKLKIFAAEGRQENERALKFNFEAVEFFICEDIFGTDLPKGKIHLVSREVYEKIAYRGSSEGIIGIYKEKETSLNDFKSKENSSIIVLESIEKPGNLGAVLRSCEAFGIDALVITNSRTDFYNPNVIRSSVGCLFGMNFFQAENQEVVDFLKKNDFQIFTTIMNTNSKGINEKNLAGKSAIVFGTEHSGLSDFWRGKGENIIVPMAGTIDSLNLSNAVAISCYEILRQKISH